MANIAKIILPKLFQQNNFNRINLVCSPESPLVYQRPYYRGLVHQKAVIRTKGIIQSTWYRREASRVPIPLDIHRSTPSGQKNQMANFGNVQNLPFAFFLPPLSAVIYAVLAYVSDRRKSIQSSGHKKDIPFLKILVTCKISKRGCPSYTYKYVFPLSKR